MTEQYIGIMSGTSLDGVDVVLVDFKNKQIQLLESKSLPFPEDLRAKIIAIQRSASINIDQLMDCDVIFGRYYANAVNQLISKRPDLKVQAIGCHGQTLWHRPPSEANHLPSSWQIGDPNIIAEQTGITTVADFRRREIAAGGQGAPLVTGFHQAAFKTKDKKRLILNLGGIANVTLLSGSQVLYAFDTGPGNALMDDWINDQQGESFDQNGTWAKEGCMHSGLLDAFISDRYFSQLPPKSTGREYFNLHWLRAILLNFSEVSVDDVQATLAELTVCSIYQTIEKLSFSADEVIVCGGGANNTYVVERLGAYFNVPVMSTEEFGIGTQWVEAMAFAWLARQRINGLEGNLPTTTGAKHGVVLGAIYA